MKYAVNALIFNSAGQLLAVSRKDNHNDFGLPGGKVDPGESLLDALHRELREETGLKIKSCMLLYSGPVSAHYISFTFLVEAIGTIYTEEAGIVKWTDFEEIKWGSFGGYNSTLEQVINEVSPIPKSYLAYEPWTKSTFKS